MGVCVCVCVCGAAGFAALNILKNWQSAAALAIQNHAHNRSNQKWKQ
jgi:hypothetical protein